MLAADILCRACSELVDHGVLHARARSLRSATRLVAATTGQRALIRGIASQDLDKGPGLTVPVASEDMMPVIIARSANSVVGPPAISRPLATNQLT